MTAAIFAIIIICAVLIFAEIKIFNRIEIYMAKSGSTNFKPQYKGYIVADTILIFVLLALFMHYN